MKRILIIVLIVFATTNTIAQVIVNGHDLNKEVEIFELWAFKKPFNNKESLFVNYDQDKFRSHYYDHKTQRIYDNKGEYFEKGEYLKLYKYLKSQGWQKIDERFEQFGDAEGRVITFEKIANENN